MTKLYLKHPILIPSWYYLTEGQDGSPAPAVHHQDAEDVARDLDEDAQEEVGVGIAREAGGGEREAVVAHRHTEPLEKVILIEIKFVCWLRYELKNS